jgi:Protein of unknown function (DUF3768)
MQFRNYYRCAQCVSASGPIFGLHNVTMTVHSVAPVTCRHTRATISRRATMNSVDALKTSARIRVLNDNFRSTFIGGQVVMSAGVADLPLGMRAQVMLKVQSFADFNANNDPYGEHDFGSFEVAGEKFFWKIDYYDSRCEFGSEDPADPEKTTRVLTIMFAAEY